MNKKVSLALCAFIQCAQAQQGPSIILKRGDTLSEALWQRGYRPLYGDGNYLEKALELNGLTMESAKRLKVGKRLRLPVAFTKTAREDLHVPFKENKKKRGPSIKYFLSLENRFLSYKDQRNAKASLEVPTFVRLGVSYKRPINDWSYVLASGLYDYQKFKAPSQASISDDTFQSFGAFAGLGAMTTGLDISLSYGREIWAAPISATESEIKMGSQTSELFLLSAKSELAGLNLEAYMKYYLPRIGGDFESKGSLLYGAECGLGENVAVFVEQGQRETSNLSEDFNSFGLRFYIKKAPNL